MQKHLQIYKRLAKLANIRKGPICLLRKLTDLEIGQVIKEKRLKRGMTQTQLGERLGVGAGAVNKWEMGKVTNIKRDVLHKLSIELKIHPATLIGLGAARTEIVINDIDFSPEEIAEIKSFISYVKSKRGGHN